MIFIVPSIILGELEDLNALKEKTETDIVVLNRVLLDIQSVLDDSEQCILSSEAILDEIEAGHAENLQLTGTVSLIISYL